jgi:carboxyl-terminal processing protease
MSNGERPQIRAGSVLWIAFCSLLLVVIVFLTIELYANKTSRAVSSLNRSSETGLSKIERVYKTVLSDYIDPPDAEELAGTAIRAMLESLDDPYSFYLDESISREFSDTVRGEFGGIGVTIIKAGTGEVPEAADSRNAYVDVISVMFGSPAAKAGLKAGDHITAINGKSVIGMRSDDVVNSLRGPKGTKVTVTVERAGVKFEVTITRAVIEIASVREALIEGTTVGYVKILTFTSLTPQAMRSAVERLKEQGATSFIFDVRNNGGGSYEAVLSMTDDLLPEGVIVTTEARNKSYNHIEKAHPSVILNKDIPIIVLINGGSASASEIFAGALQANGRARVIGSKSFGKAKVQTLYPLKSDLSESFKITTAYYYTPDGRNIDKEGIIPDLLIEDEAIEETEQNRESYRVLVTGGSLHYFERLGREPTGKELEAFVASLRRQGNTLPESFLIRSAIETAFLHMDTPPVYSMAHDYILKRAVEELTARQ